ncbi:alpha and gamma adaptin binding protein p34-domain-containing protein [Neurospora hispaniola]|uniref:Alpha and gamma adaptin binding protein p34-domain-containing protein n=1 Tax=Neurospora hispaniola TaxID=588809 RepID=A0AAJ0IFA4_9PEZI|nr:alpha and gamma adaptin binding protein p34-domain-containing protein [Neurospora hispaniola]
MVPTKVEEIGNPRRILAVALTDSSDHLGAVIRDLTGTAPTPQQQQPPSQEDEEEEDSSEHTATEPSLAGITHHLPLSTTYYTASIPIWLDLIASPGDWSASFLSEEAKEVLGVLGGVVCVFEIPFTSAPGSSSSSDDDAKVKAQKEKTKGLIKGVGKVVREGLGGWEWEGVGLAVGVTTTATITATASDIGGGGGEITTMEMDADMEDEINEWDDLCAEWGLEFVHHRVVGSSNNNDNRSSNNKGEEKKNEYGEKMGIARVLEALQSNDWSGGDGDEGDNNNNNNRGLFDESEDEEDYVDENDGDTEDEFDLGFGYTKKQKMEMRKAFLKGTADSNRTAEEELEASKSVTQTIEGQEKTKKKGEEKGESAAVATDVANAGPSAESGSGADKVKEEEIGEEDVEKIAKMMLKLQAVRDMSGTVPEEQRRKLALKAVEEVMREL